MSVYAFSGPQPRAGTAIVDGTEVSFRDSVDDQGHDELVVLVHGTGGSAARHFGFVFPVLAARRRVVAVDWAEPPGDESLEVDALVRQVAAVIRLLERPATVTLVGYSLGAVVAAALAAEHPDLVDQLVLVAGWMTTDLQQRLRNDVYRELRRSGSDAVRAYSVFTAFGGPFLASRAYEDIKPTLDGMSFTRFGDRQMELNRDIDISGIVPSIRATTLVIGCVHDQMVPVRHSRALFGAIDDARLIELSAGHAIVFERPAELCSSILDFLDDPTAAPAGSIIPVSKP
jgi:pimeloyl-ACP methyl ester carboxylesterase